MRFALFALGFVAACSGTTEPSDLPVNATPSAADFTKGAGAIDVPFTLTNGSNRTIYVTNCGGQVSVVVERRANAGWEVYSGGGCPTLELQVPMALTAGSTRPGVVSIADVGEFRLRPLFALGPYDTASPGRASTPVLIHGPTLVNDRREE